MRTPLLVLACLLGASTASAEVRFINATGEPLTVDVLHADGQVRDLALSPDRSITKGYGPMISDDDTHMVVIRNAAGKELKREKLRGNRIHVIKYWGSSTDLTTGDVGTYRGWEADPAQVGLINGTGEELKFKTELPDFSVREAESDPNGKKDVHFTKLYNLAKEPGHEVSVEITGETLAKSTQKMVTGGLYYLTRDKGTLVVKKVEKQP